MAIIKTKPRFNKTVDVI